jgi:hypothetical protein
MTPEEKAVIQAAIEWRRAIPGRDRDVRQTIELESKIWDLIIRCPQCNAGGHQCPGDGNPIGHGDRDCGEHDDVCNNCAPLRAGASVDRVDGSDLTTPCSECGAIESVTASLVATAELRAAIESVKSEVPLWALRTWADVRKGDTVRMPGSEITATITDRLWHPSEDPRGESWHVVHDGTTDKWAHTRDRFVQPGECVIVSPDITAAEHGRWMEPTAGVEILLPGGEAELAAIELLGGFSARLRTAEG